MTEWAKLAGQFWPDIACPALRGLYLVGCDWDGPLVYRRNTNPKLGPSALTGGYRSPGEMQFVCRFTFSAQAKGGRQGRQLLGRELALELARIAEDLNTGRYNEARAVVEMGFLGKAEWPMPPRPEEPYYTARKGSDMYIYRDYPFFRVRFDPSWTTTHKHDPGVTIFHRKVAPAIVEILFSLNAGLLTEEEARHLASGRLTLNKKTGVFTSTTTSTV